MGQTPFYDDPMTLYDPLTLSVSRTQESDEILLWAKVLACGTGDFKNRVSSLVGLV